MGLSGFFVISVIIAILVLLFFNVAPMAVILLGGLAVFMFTGVVTPAEALSGLSNQGMVTVALLFVVAAGIQNTGALNSIASNILGKSKKSKIGISMLKLMIPASFFSAFLNNTPIVVIFTPIVKKWAEKLDWAPSKFLIPLSYAAIFGGVCTLIGTSTNLIVNGMMIESDFKGLSMFELAKIGIPCTVIGWLYLAFVGQRILPNNKDIFETIRKNRKEYVIEMKVMPGCELIDKSIKDAGLRNLKNVYLLQIERDGKLFGPVSPKERIRENDTLLFVGLTSAVVDLQDIPGLVPAAHNMFEKDFSKVSAHIVEAVVAEVSPILGKSVKEANFRSRYNAGVIAIHRNGERVKAKIGDIKLKAGDVLLLLARDEFLRDWSDSNDFYLISKIREREPRLYHKVYIAVAILAAMVLSVAFRDRLPQIAGQKISMLYAAVAAAALMIITRCVTIAQSKNFIKFNVLLSIVAALGISKALSNSGAAAAIAGLLLNLVKEFGAIGALAMIYLTTTVLTEIITNNAAAALMFPIAFSTAMKLGASPRPFFIAIAIAASASFATPIGYQTNLIVQGAGRYKFSDYLKVGLPLNALFFMHAF